MCKHVALEANTMIKSLLTQVTFVLSFVRMCQHVFLQTGRHSELLVTLTAFVTPFSRMNKLVFLKMGRHSELLVTHTTFVTPFSRMNKLVYLKIGTSRKSLLTDFALVLSAFNFNRHMCTFDVLLKTGRASKLFVTEITQVSPLTCMSLHVFRKVVTFGKSLPTHLTVVWMNTGVGIDV